MAAASTSSNGAGPSTIIRRRSYSLPPLQICSHAPQNEHDFFFHIDDEYDSDNFGDVTALEPAKIQLASKISSEYADAKVLPPAILAQQQAAAGPARPGAPNAAAGAAARPIKRREMRHSSLVDRPAGWRSASVAGVVGPVGPSSSSQALTIRSTGVSAGAAGQLHLHRHHRNALR